MRFLTGKKEETKDLVIDFNECSEGRVESEVVFAKVKILQGESEIGLVGGKSLKARCSL